MNKIIEKKLYKYKQELNSLQAALSAMNPRAVLDRGYSITRSLPDGEVVVDASRILQRQDLEIILAKGTLEVNVVKRHPSSNNRWSTMDKGR